METRYIVINFARSHLADNNPAWLFNRLFQEEASSRVNAHRKHKTINAVGDLMDFSQYCNLKMNILTD